MFEDSLIESGGQIKTKKGATVFISVIVHTVLVLVLILIPLLSYSEIELGQLQAMMLAPPPPPPAAPPPPPPAAPSAPKPVQVQRPQIDPSALVAPTEIPKEIARIVDEAPAAASVGFTGVPGGVPGGVIGGVVGGVIGGAPVAAPPPPPPPPPPAAAPVQRLRVSSGVIQGNLISRPELTYPQMARTVRAQGPVVIEATIGKDGTMENLKVISSAHPLLTQPALDYVRQWRYKPYILNDQPVEVITTITINFQFQ